MWHEARKQEKKIRGMMVDFKKRAERRREYYETIKLDPAQFLQIHGRACKIQLDPAVSHAAESPATMMPWQGQKTNMIDRFDVRAHLDIIPEYAGIGHLLLSPEAEKEERKCNYERYRVLVQNDYAGNTEEQCLQQIYIDEMFPELQNKNEVDKSKKLPTKKAAIGFSYDDSTPAAGEADKDEGGDGSEDENDSEDSLSDLEIDNVNLDVEELTAEQEVMVNQVGERYGMASKQFTQLLRKEKEEAEDLKKAKAEEEERAMYSGRKSRRERRAYIEKRLREKKAPSPPSYARRDSPTYDPYPSHRKRSSSGSRSSTPEGVGTVTFITSFGGEEDATKKVEKKKSITKDNSELHRNLQDDHHLPAPHHAHDHGNDDVHDPTHGHAHARIPGLALQTVAASTSEIDDGLPVVVVIVLMKMSSHMGKDFSTEVVYYHQLEGNTVVRDLVNVHLEDVVGECLGLAQVQIHLGHDLDRGVWRLPHLLRLRNLKKRHQNPKFRLLPRPNLLQQKIE